MALVSSPQEARKFLWDGGSDNGSFLLGGVSGEELFTPRGRDVSDNDMRQSCQEYKLICSSPGEAQRASVLGTHLRSIDQRIGGAKNGHERAPIQQGRSPTPKEAEVKVVCGLFELCRLEGDGSEGYALFSRRSKEGKAEGPCVGGELSSSAPVQVPSSRPTASFSSDP